MRYQQAAMALAMQGFLPGAQAGIMLKRTGNLLGGLQGLPRLPVGAPQPGGPGGIGGPGAVPPPPPPGQVGPPPPAAPPASDALTPSGTVVPGETANPTDAGPILITLSSADISNELRTEAPTETPTLIAEPPTGPASTIETPSVVETPSIVGTPATVETPAAVETPSTVETPAAVETPSIVQTPSIVETPATVETPAAVETPSIVQTPSIVETPTTVETAAEIVQTPAGTPTETPGLIQPPPAETPLVTPPAETEAELPAGNPQKVTVTVTQEDGKLETVTQTLAGETITGQDVTVTITKDNGAVETVTQALPVAAVTAIIAQPIIIIVQQTTNFNFNFSLGGVCPPVVADPAGSGGFVVGDNAMLPTLPQACQAACQTQFKQCSAKAGASFQVADCEKQLSACNDAAATETLVDAPPQTVTKSVFLPATGVPGVEQELSSDGCAIISTKTLPPDQVATIGDGGISVITTTAKAEATAAQDEAVETTMVVTLEAPPAGGAGDNKPSVVTMTMTGSAPSKGTDEAGKPGKGRPGDGRPGKEVAGSAPSPPPTNTNVAAPPPPPTDTNVAAPPPPKATDGPGRGTPAGRPAPPAGAGECPEAVTVTVTQAAVTVTVTVTKGSNTDAVNTDAVNTDAVECPAEETTSLVQIVQPTPEATPPALETPLLPPAGTTLTTKIGTSPTDVPAQIPDKLSVGKEQPAAAQAPHKGLFGSLFGH
ncbi:hypothetical protein NLU13_5616 [Sarocladium strictum]|uniref:Uncharacterized protein n=1 Tax=Sarocladium strictum TaxID=5046 RepID=A0AA39L7T8_SARSR|nr:hypothetical protein NLU13_5616 [Sarocladium strictum]